MQTALGGHQSVNDYIIPGGRIYEQREYIYKSLTDIPGITAVKPKAAFYIFPKIDTKKFNITNVPGGRIYEQREYIYKSLTDIPGITAVKPKAAFYIFPKIDTKKFNITNDEQFALDLLREKKILLIHGGGFNWKEPDHFRVVYLPRIEVLEKAAGEIADFLSFYHQQ